MSFKDGGAPDQKLSIIGDAPTREPNYRPFWPDKEIFKEGIEFRAATIERFQMMAFLNKGLEIKFLDSRKDTGVKEKIFAK